MDKHDWIQLILSIINTILALLAYLEQFRREKSRSRHGF